MKDPTHFQGQVIMKKRKYIVKIKKSFSPEPLGQFQPNLAQSILELRQFKFVQMKGPVLFQGGDNYEIAKIHRWNLKIFFLQNHLANFNQTWHKASLGEGDASLFKRRTPPISKGRLLSNSENTLTKLKNRLLQNH